MKLKNDTDTFFLLYYSFLNATSNEKKKILKM